MIDIAMDVWQQKMIEIRHLRPGTLDVEVVRRFLVDSTISYPVELRGLDLMLWPAKLVENAECFCVQRYDGTLSAALFAYLNDMHSLVGYIPFICVLPESIKTTGHRLHDAYVGLARKRGMRSLKLEVLKTNSRALSFYLRHGYRVISDHGDKWLMESFIE